MWCTELRNSCEGIHELEAIQYFVDGCRDVTFLKHKLMCQEPTTLVQLMAVIDKYDLHESSVKLPVLVDATDKPTLAKPVATTAAGGSQLDQGKRKTNQSDAHYESRQVAFVEDRKMTNSPSSGRC
ncbi:endoglucanase 3 [Hordeum vulgare]|nr:endoglucanase 3 [Hordeum vulgare]